MLAKGYVHVYTGEGKGKTTAALGLVLRACGAGLNVLLAQFLKSRDYSELEGLSRLGGQVTIKQYGSGSFVRGDPTELDHSLAQLGLREIREAVLSGRYSLVVLDEANVAVHYGLIALDDLLELVDRKPYGVELVITGRYADSRLVEKADLVTEMREIKHYYKIGVPARRGIEK